MASFFGIIKRHLVFYLAVSISVGSIMLLQHVHTIQHPHSVAITVPAESSFPKPTVSGIPVEVKIAAAHIDLQVLPGTYDKNTDSWTLSGYNAQFATITRPANNAGGNTFIYGHNNKYVFGPIKTIAPGSEAELITDNGNRFYYRLVSTSTVEPVNVSLFGYTGPPILTIQTCTGRWYEKRQIYTFAFRNVVESNEGQKQRSVAEQKKLLHDLAAVSSPNFRIVNSIHPGGAETSAVK